MERREFLKAAAITVVPAMAARSLSSAAGTMPAAEQGMVGQTADTDARRSDEMTYRPLGTTGEKVSVLGLGGFHIGIPRDQQEGIRIIRSAIDHGVTFMDNSWDYHDGDSERRMGKALRDGYRQKVFLMTKVDGRTEESAARQIDESLRRLDTDHVDLMQFHEIIRLEDPDRIFTDNGAIKAFQAAKTAGKIRFIGFTGHKDPLVHLRMLDVAREHGFRFDAVQMPLNVMDAHFRSFAHHVLPVLVKEKIGVLGMKPMGSGIILQSNLVKPVECLHFAMSLPTSTVITGIDSMKILDQDLDAARTFSPLTPRQLSSLLTRTARAATGGRYELFKTSNQFDSTAAHPQWLG
jgi:predicted aldo/keto reductase-like oxidoreductase